MKVLELDDEASFAIVQLLGMPRPLCLKREHLHSSLSDSVQVQDGVLLMNTKDAREVTVSIKYGGPGCRESSMEDQPRIQARKEPVSFQTGFAGTLR